MLTDNRCNYCIQELLHVVYRMLTPLVQALPIKRTGRGAILYKPHYTSYHTDGAVINTVAVVYGTDVVVNHTVEAVTMHKAA